VRRKIKAEGGGERAAGDTKRGMVVSFFLLTFSARQPSHRLRFL